MWWSNLLQWLKMDHRPGPGAWQEELSWIIERAKGRREKGRVLRCAVAGTIYDIWRVRNKKMHGE